MTLKGRSRGGALAVTRALAQFQASNTATVRTHAHAGGEFICVLEGTLELAAGTSSSRDAQDSGYFDASRPHGYRRYSAKPCRAVVVTSPA